MENKQETKLSKFLSFILRHSPEEIQLTIDKNGWADVQELIDKASKHHHYSFSKENIEFVVANNNKQRFILSEDRKKIKANQGHTIQVELNLLNVEPPEFLYHGTAQQFLPLILKEGLKPMKRHDVHLSFSQSTAKNVGARHGSPVVIRIKSKKMYEDGILFQCTPNNVWLTQFVDPKYFELNF